MYGWLMIFLGVGESGAWLRRSGGRLCLSLVTEIAADSVPGDARGKRPERREVRIILLVILQPFRIRYGELISFCCAVTCIVQLHS